MRASNGAGSGRVELEAGSRQCTVLIIIFVPEAVFVYDVQLRLLCEIRLINSQRGRSLDWSLLSVVIFVNRDFGNLLLAVSVEFFGGWALWIVHGSVYQLAFCFFFFTWDYTIL